MTLKGVALIAVPAGVVTVMEPVDAPAGWSTRTFVAVFEMIAADVPLKATAVAVPRLSPVIVTADPSAPALGGEGRDSRCHRRGNASDRAVASVGEPQRLSGPTVINAGPEIPVPVKSVAIGHCMGTIPDITDNHRLAATLGRPAHTWRARRGRPAPAARLRPGSRWVYCSATEAGLRTRGGRHGIDAENPLSAHLRR
jgi:hypothetical protein